MKAAAERHNILLVNAKNPTPSSVFYNNELEAIHVKTFQTLFCPVYVLDRKAQSTGGPVNVCLPRALPISLRKCGARVQSDHQPSVATVSSCL